MVDQRLDSAPDHSNCPSTIAISRVTATMLCCAALVRDIAVNLLGTPANAGHTVRWSKVALKFPYS